LRVSRLGAALPALRTLARLVKTATSIALSSATSCAPDRGSTGPFLGSLGLWAISSVRR
jgi:hypothetical protein